MIAAPAIKRRIGIGLVAICAALLTSACATGQQAQTADTVPAVDATSGSVGDLQLDNVAIKAPDGPSYSAGAAAELQLVIVNTGRVKDTLQSLSSPAVSGYQVFATPDEASAAASPSASGTPSGSTSDTPSGSNSASGSTSASASTSASDSAAPPASSSASAQAGPVALDVPAGQALEFSVNSADPVLLIRLNKALFPGTTASITFTFANAGSVTLDVPVQITANGTAGLTILPPSETGAA